MVYIHHMYNLSKAANVPLNQLLSKICNIFQLKEQGILTDLEFKHAKAKLGQ